jgi:hypothetical protein
MNNYFLQKHDEVKEVFLIFCLLNRFSTINLYSCKEKTINLYQFIISDYIGSIKLIGYKFSWSYHGRCI